LERRCSLGREFLLSRVRVPEILATWSGAPLGRQYSRKLSARDEVIDMLKQHAIEVLRCLRSNDQLVVHHHVDTLSTK
jgi:hypothetical protein